MAYRYTDIAGSGIVVDSEELLERFEGVARWVRTEIADLTPSGTPQSAESDRPRGNASREKWSAYALTHGYTEAQIESLSRDEIAEKFPA